MSMRRAFLLCLPLTACGGAIPPPARHRAPSATIATTSSTLTVDDELALVTRVHGAPGPWAVLGYRMGKKGLHDLDLSPGSFDLDVTHFTPNKVQYSCIADGAQAATRASAGKLNLRLVEATDEDVATTYTNKKTHASVTFAPTKAFRATYMNAPRERASELGREVMLKPDGDLFERIRIE